ALSKAPANPRGVAVAAGSSGNDDPAMAPAPSGLTSARRPASWNRPASLTRAKPWAASWKDHSTGWAGWGGGRPGADRAGGVGAPGRAPPGGARAGRDQGVDQPGDGVDGVGAGLLEPQVQVGGDLVVAAAAGVELAGGRADQAGRGRSWPRAGPPSSVRRRSTALWTSSSPSVNSNRPAASSRATWARPSSRSLPSPPSSTPAVTRPRTWVRLPATSWRQRRRSTASEEV